MASDGLVAREGDVLVVNYPEIRVPVAPYCTVGVGGLVYTRQLRDGDDPEQEYRRIYDYLDRQVKADARVKIAQWSEEVGEKKKTPAQKPSSGGRQ